MPEDKFNSNKVIALAESINDCGKRAILWANCGMHDKVDSSRDRMDIKLIELIKYLKIHFPETEI